MDPRMWQNGIGILEKLQVCFPSAPPESSTSNTSADGITPVSFFRGRKLYGRALKLPKGHKGVVVTNTDRILPKATQPPTEDEEEEEMEADVKVLEEQATFDEVMVWGHEVVVDEGSDPYVRGVEEWIGFAEQVRFVFWFPGCWTFSQGQH